MKLRATRMVMCILLTLALLSGAIMTFAGGLAPLYPVADYFNHFRPYTLAGTTVLTVAALAVGGRWTTLASALLLGINAVLFALPLLWSAERAELPSPGHALNSARTHALKIVTLNMGYADPARVARFLIEQDADIVALQEIGPRQMAALRPVLRKRYPYSHACQELPRCAAAMFAKRPWVAAGREYWSDDAPELIWAQFDDAKLGKFRLVGVHAAQPRKPQLQVSHANRLIALRRTLTGPVVFAGDFNLTPWSYRLQMLLARAGMWRHTTFLRSWPARPVRAFRIAVPAFLIDHVITTPDITTASIRTGPNVGSDHLPVIAQLKLPIAEVGLHGAHTQRQAPTLGLAAVGQPAQRTGAGN